MAERRIVIYGDPILREVSKPVDPIDQETKDLVSDLKDTLKKASGLGLAAVQIGVPKRVFIVDLSVVDLSAALTVFINPEIIETSGEAELEEGCLSFPGIYQKISRAARIKIRVSDVDGRQFELDEDGLAARAIIHEYDHLEGKLFIDHFTPMARSMVKGRLRKLSAVS